MIELLEGIRKYNEEYATKEPTTAEQLRNKAFNLIKTDEEWEQLKKDMHEYRATDPPESELDILMSFGEMVGMMCSAIRKEKSGND